jgi:hypothetical protein
MVADFFHGLSILKNLFLFPRFQRAANLQGAGLYLKDTLDGEKFSPMLQVERVARLQGTFGKGEVVDAVQHIRFSTTISAYQTIDLPAEGKLGFAVVFELNKVEGLQNHAGGELFAWYPNFKDGIVIFEA